MTFVPSADLIIAGRYRLERPLGRGGMGAVWVARHVELEVEVAIKFILDTEGEEAERARARFKREAKAAARLKSPHITHVHDYGVHEGAPYIAMELLLGEDLATLLGKCRVMPIERAAAIAEQIGLGLGEAHQAGILHRDIKPSNIFLARAGEAEIAKLLDFGIAKMGSGSATPPSERTRTGVVIGSPAYMSPEQTRGFVLDERSDLWSLAVVVFEMLTGSSPFARTHHGDMVHAILSEPPPSAHPLAPSLPGTIDRFFERAFAKKPEHRFASASRFCEALWSVANGEPLPELAAIDTKPAPAAQSDNGTLRSIDAHGPTVQSGHDTAARAIGVITARDRTRFGQRSYSLAALMGGLLLLAGGWALGRAGDPARVHTLTRANGAWRGIAAVERPAPPPTPLRAIEVRIPSGVPAPIAEPPPPRRAAPVPVQKPASAASAGRDSQFGI